MYLELLCDFIAMVDRQLPACSSTMQWYSALCHLCDV
jgi:hypothetical protein